MRCCFSKLSLIIPALTESIFGASGVSITFKEVRALSLWTHFLATTTRCWRRRKKPWPQAAWRTPSPTSKQCTATSPKSPRYGFCVLVLVFASLLLRGFCAQRVRSRLLGAVCGPGRRAAGARGAEARRGRKAQANGSRSPSEQECPDAAAHGAAPLVPAAVRPDGLAPRSSGGFAAAAPAAESSVVFIGAS